ncbi:unnamed protein product [Parajaminaea phylloscopi]
MPAQRQSSFTFALLNPLNAFQGSPRRNIRKRQTDATFADSGDETFDYEVPSSGSSCDDVDSASELMMPAWAEKNHSLPLALGQGRPHPSANAKHRGSGSVSRALTALFSRRNRLVLLVLFALGTIGWLTVATMPPDVADVVRRPFLDRILPAEGDKVWNPVTGALSHAQAATSKLYSPSTDKLSASSYRIAILENWACHDEVTASFMQALADTKHNLISYLRDIRFEADKIFESFAWRNPPFILDNAVFGKGVPPHAVISVSCKNDVGRFSHELNLDSWAEQGKTMLYCVIHDCDEWDAWTPDWEGDRGIDGRPIMKKWIEQDRVRFVTLSPHVTKCAKSKTLPYLGVPADSAIANNVRTFVPLFEVPELSEQDREQRLELSSDSVYLAVQGKLDPGRRAYTDLFAGLIRRLKDERPSVMAKVKLLILGASPPDRKGKALAWPAPLRGRITLGESLPYPHFYEALRHVGALLPSFSKRAYLETKASSTVAASIISGAPMVADQALLDTYSYLPRECVWFREEGETELEAALRGIEGPTSVDAIRQKKDCLDRLLHQVVRDNAVSLQEWLHEDLKAVTMH